jgi:nucleoside-diphosphate-sugar epimerase
MSYCKNILITGATGFVGRHLLQDIDADNYQIRLTTRKHQQKLQKLYPNFEVVVADLNNLNELKDALCGIDVVINTAAEVRNEGQLAITNIGGTRNLIEAVVYHKIKKLIHLSSVGVVGKQYSASEIIIDEENKCFPKNEYERTKLISEDLIIEAQKLHQFKLDIIRPTNVFGENHPFNALLGLFKYIKSGKPFIYGSHAKVNYVYVKDLTYLICYLLKIKDDKGIVNIGQSVDLAYFYQQVQEILISKNKNIIIPDFLTFAFNSIKVKKIESVTNKVVYSDKKLLEFYNYPYGEFEGLKRTITHYKHLNLLT